MRLPDHHGGRRKARIEIVPLIDIMFFLLATFMMVSLSMVENQGMKVKLPVADTTSSQQKNESMLTLTVDSKGVIYANKEAVSAEALPAYLEKYRERTDQPRVLINGDEGASWQAVVSVLDQTRAAGISQVAILTDKER